MAIANINPGHLFILLILMFEETCEVVQSNIVFTTITLWQF